MRNTRFVIPAALAAVFTCGDGIDVFSIQESSSATIPGATILEQLAGDLGFGGFVSFDLTDNQELKNQGVERHQIDSVVLTGLSLTIREPPSGQDFTFLDELRFFAEAPGQSRVLIASGGPFPAGESMVSMTVVDVDLADYASAESMTITTEVAGRRPPQETVVDAVIDLRVNVDLSGAACGG